MLESKDLQKIGEELGKVIEQNVTPTLDAMDGRMGSFEGRMGSLEKKVDHVEAEMVTKSYLDDKLADLEGSLHAKLRKEDVKVNPLIDILQKGKFCRTKRQNNWLTCRCFQRLPSANQP